MDQAAATLHAFQGRTVDGSWRAGGERSGLESGEVDREIEPEDDRSGGPERDSVEEETLDVEQMSVDRDLEL